ncbi:cation/H(+) antiporter [Frankia sp. CcI156]|uniref:Potassium/proton antiporter membrane subunit, CPA2 family n=1 Tax=Frankia casuarinae (strain DSM 45818 / CECT 9043 / HFP020203 / CcI3) TaxID=106370 RepID=Q2JBS3_FRACC|nr:MULTISPECIES: cation:proton antiporter [Frankia]ABD11269.1 potassium/proton antiporter membrane subunit, CPA2 family [Frankia casuarinae]ETA03166.1 potassium/proton antiporter membrane subunit, CPA2 family [Frankia sp. CcI6]EYT90318.1 potassium/proton antiporter membrane subunit, CPA2 family [Frankia casuarinae]KFB02842.1 potassium/proton antiporter membrane subunit, CPA2 family [Frankia sp. Allo2]OHV50985.1 potassium transporter [Frankia sp. CgIS1]
MHSTATTFLELGGILFCLGVLGHLALRISVSPIPLYLVGGLAFGRGGLLPLGASEEFIGVGAEIGVVLLLLTLGLEYTADELLSGLRRQAPAGVLDLALNATPGVVAAFLLGWGPTAAVVLGGVTAISSSGIIAKVLGDLGRLGNRETPVVLSVLVLEDLAMAVYLPVLTALLAHHTFVRGSLTVAIALGVLVAVLYIALRHSEKVTRLVFNPKAHRNDEILLLRALGLALFVAGVAQRMQVSAAVGAFLVGIALSGPVAEGAEEVLRPLRDLFAAVFFVFFGMQTDPAEIPPALLTGSLLAIAGVATKVMTGWWAARSAGIGTMGRFRAGAALVARGEFSIVIAGLAVAAGLEPRLGPLAACYVLLMAVLGPLAARFVEPVIRTARRLQAARSP